jgi:uncharacterized protein (DUF302 family)
MGKRARALATVAGLAMGGMGTAQGQTDPGLVTLASHHAVANTIERFEAAVRAKGWVIFTTIDHAAAAKTAGLELAPRTVIVFGNPKAGTDPMRSNPTLAIDLPMKALVWQDPAGKVWLTYNSADYVGGALYPRHGFDVPPEARKGMADLFAEFARQATE